MKRLALLACASLLAIALAVPGVASANPKFAKKYTGTVSGSTSEIDGVTGRTVKTDWTVAGLRFKRMFLRTRGGITGAAYKLTAGTATVHAAETGQCTYDFKKTLDVPPALPHPYIAAPLYLSFASGAYGHSASANLEIEKHFTIIESCANGDGQPPDLLPVDYLPMNFLNFGGKAPKSYKHLRGSYKQSHDGNNGADHFVEQWHWNLK